MQRAEGARLLDELRLDTADARTVTSDLIYVKKLDQVLRAEAEQPPSEAERLCAAGAGD